MKLKKVKTLKVTTKVEPKLFYIPYSRRPKKLDDASYALGRKVSKKVHSDYHSNSFYISYKQRPKDITDEAYALGRRVTKKAYDKYQLDQSPENWVMIPYAGKRKTGRTIEEHNLGRRVRKDSKSHLTYLTKHGKVPPPPPPPTITPPPPPPPKVQSSRTYILSGDQLIGLTDPSFDLALPLRDFLNTVVSGDDSEVDLSYYRINGDHFTHSFNLSGTVNQVWKLKSTFQKFWTIGLDGKSSYLTPWNLDRRDHGSSNELTITIKELVEPDHTTQNYKKDVLGKGEYEVFNCLLSPIKGMIMTDLENIKNDISQCAPIQKKRRCTLMKRRSEKVKLIKVADELLDKYACYGGVPERDLQRISNMLCLSITIKNLRGHNEHVAVYDKSSNSGRCWGSIKFVNTLIDHVEVLTLHDTRIYGNGNYAQDTQNELCLIVESQEEMRKILNQCKVAYESNPTNLFTYMETRDKVLTVIGTCKKSYKYVTEYSRWRDNFVDGEEPMFFDAKGNGVNYRSLGINTKDNLSSDIARMGYHVTSSFDFNYDKRAIYCCVDEDDTITHITLDVDNDCAFFDDSKGAVDNNYTISRTVIVDKDSSLWDGMDPDADTDGAPAFTGGFKLGSKLEVMEVIGIKRPSHGKTLEYDGPWVLANIQEAFPDRDIITFKHHDQQKAYIQFKSAPTYQAFPQNISEHGLLHEVDDVEEFMQANVGMYKASSIDFTDVDPTMKAIIMQMYFDVTGVDLYNKVVENPTKVLTSAEWLYFISIGADVTLQWGAWGPTVDFEFGEDSYGKTEKGTPFYSYFSGSLAAIYEESGINVPCSSHAMARKLASQYDKLYYDDKSNIATIQVKVDDVTHKTHISSFICAYQRVNLLNQVAKSKVQYDDIIRIVMDGIYTKASANFNAIDTFRPEPKQLKGSAASEMISSNDILIDTSEWVSITEAYWNRSAVSGAGGDGKTTAVINLLKKRFTRVGYTTMAKELVSSKQVELGLDPTLCWTWHHYLGLGTIKKAEVHFPTVLFIDEIGMLTQPLKEQLIAALPNSKLVFAGDFSIKHQATYQLQGISNTKGGSCRQESMCNLEGFDHIEAKNPNHEFELNFRCTDPVLWEDLGELRKMQEKMWDDNLVDPRIATAWMRRKLKTRTRAKSRLNRDYKPTDLIVTSRKSCKTCDAGLDHAVEKTPCTAFANQHTKYLDDSGKPKRWVCTRNSIDGVNGQVKICEEQPGPTWELRHASTINAVQGRTVDDGRTLYIDPRKLFSNSHVYTIMSRARSYDQLRMIDFPEDKGSTTKQTVHDRAIAALRKQLLSGTCAQFAHFDFDSVVIEYSVTGVPRRVDIMLLKHFMPVHAIEVFSTNAVSAEKAADLAKAGIDWTEVHARDIIQEDVITCIEEIDMEAIEGHVPIPKLANATNKFRSLINNRKIVTHYQRGCKDIGRLYASNMGLCYINKKFRALAAGSLYMESDIKNAQPEIMRNYAIKNNIDLAMVTYYCHNREEVLDILKEELCCDRDDAKEAILKILFGGTPDPRSMILQQFKYDTDRIGSHVNIHHPKYLEYVSRRYVCEGKIKRSALAMWAQTIESQLMLRMWEFAIDHGVPVGALIYDGILVRKGPKLTEAFNIGMEEYVLAKTGYSIKIVFKSFDKVPEGSIYDRLELDMPDSIMFDCECKIPDIEGWLDEDEHMSPSSSAL